MDILTDKKLIIGSLLSVAVVFSVFLVTGYINLPFYQTQPTENATGPGNCLILEEQYCQTARFYTIDANGTKAAALNVPHGTPIFMPFDGTYSDESPNKVASSERIGLHAMDGNYSATIITKYSPALEDDTSVSRGDVLGVSINNNVNNETSDNDFNFVIYTENYDLGDLFSS